MTATPLTALTQDQVEKAILLEVVTRFMNSNQSTSRHSLVIKSEGQPVFPQAMFKLMNGSLLYREGSTMPTDEEKYLPGALAFEFCGDSEFREDAKSATTVVLHTVKEMYKSDQNKLGFTFKDLERYAANKFPGKPIDSSTLKLGLYLAKNFSVLTSYGPSDGPEVTQFRVQEWAMSIADPDTEWDAMVYRSTPRPLESTEDFSYAGLESLTQAQSYQTFLPAGSQHNAYVELRKILSLAKREVLIVDNYVDHTLWELMTNTESTVNVRILTDHMKKDFCLEARKFTAQYGRKIEIRKTSSYHDRFIIEDGERCWHIGASIKDAGSKAFLLSELVGGELVRFVISNVTAQWSNASVVTL